MTKTTMVPRFLFSILFLALAASIAYSKKEDECVYTVYVRTGSVIKSGTDAQIGIALGDSDGGEIQVSDLKSWGGLMGPTHDYFERGNLDAFSGRGPCGLSAPLCRLNLTSDGSGAHHGWFCEYVEVTATGPHVPCTQTIFYVGQWLATDAPPYQLYATVDGCDRVRGDHRRGMSSFEVGKKKKKKNDEEEEEVGSSAASM